MRGHCAYKDQGVLFASIAGVVDRVNKLPSISATRARLVTSLSVDIMSRLEWGAQEKISGGRRMNSQWEDTWRRLVGGSISVQVHNIFNGDSLFLNRRSLKYGKLGQGFVVTVSPSLKKGGRRIFTSFCPAPASFSGITGSVRPSAMRRYWVCSLRIWRWFDRETGRCMQRAESTRSMDIDGRNFAWSTVIYLFSLQFRVTGTSRCRIMVSIIGKHLKI